MKIIDLSQDIYEGMKVYPGHLKTVQFEHATHEETAPRFEGGFSFQTTGFMLNDNGPTHVDSFSHLDPDPSAETIEQMSLDLFYGPAVCLDVTGFAPRTDITADDLDRVEAAGGLAVLLWHPNAADEGSFPGWWACYEAVLERLAARGAWVAPAGEIADWWEARLQALHP
jgi:kynurenine formamidase